ncbi:hypothetical protein [Virgibacillus halodenitrificans]|uniref:hypothetical protein n=1 Tax=Virgibacillus halodenitrificans TaxID=1482 RepID=UPI000EF51452|nr:hypothetical protein [Virgibacillus halodenitrificans]
MIIHEEQVLKGMKDGDKKVSLSVNIKETLRMAQALFNSLNEANEDESLVSAITETEGKMNRVLLGALNAHPLVNLNTFAYENVIEDSIRYLFVPKEQQVEDYVVDVVIVFFKCEGENSEISVNLPFYLVSDQEQEFLVSININDETTIESLQFL